MKNIIKNTCVLTAITLVSGLLLGLVYEVTKEPIALSKEKAKQEAYKQVLSEADAFETDSSFDQETAKDILNGANLGGCTIDEVVVGMSGSEVAGYVITSTSSEGYGGNIQISTGITSDGTVNGVAILSISETAGLGMKATEPEFLNQYQGKNVEAFTVTKTGAANESEIDALSGATITSNAVTNAINASLSYFQQVIGGGANE